MATIDYGMNEVSYTPKGADEPTAVLVIYHEIDDEFVGRAYMWALWNRANQNVSAVPANERMEALVAEATRMHNMRTLDKVPTERTRRYTDQKLVQALFASGLVANLADAQATYKKNVTDAGFTTKDEVAERVAALCEKYPDLAAAYNGQEAGESIDL